MKFSGLKVNGDGTADFMFIISPGHYVNYPAKRCSGCGGDGRYLGEVAKIDYVHGGYLEEKEMTCEDCDGYGWVVKEDGQEES